MTKSFATYLAPYGVTVNAVAPSPVRTDLTSNWGEESFANFTRRILVGQLGTTAEVAELLVFLASDKSRFITGATKDINGGWIMR